MRLARVVSISFGVGLLVATGLAYAPAVVGAVVAGLAFEGVLALTGSALLGALAAGATSLVVGKALAPGRQQGLPTFQAEAKDRQTIVRSPVEPRRIVYGRVAVSGPLIYTESTGSDNQYLHLVIALADHEVEEIRDIYFNDEKVPLDDDGLGMGKWAHTAQTESTHEEAIPGSPFQITVPDTVRATKEVALIANLFNGDTEVQFTFYEVPENNIDSFVQYSRNDSVYTFSSAIQDWINLHPPFPGLWDYSIKITYFSTSVADGSYVRVKKHLGTADQVADTDLVAESGTGSPASEGRWTSEHKLSGIAYIYVRLEFSHDIFPTGIPNIKAVVLGKKLYDPRVGGSPQTATWTDNWALVMRDYLTSSYGLDCDDDEIDDDLIIAAANICDETVDTGFGSPNIGTQKRYTANGTVNLSDRPVDILRTLASAGAGAAVFAEGEWKIFAGAYDTPTIEIDEDWLRGSVKIRAKPPRRELFNGVRGVFADADRFWQPTDFPPVTNSTYATQDGGQEIMRDIELPFTTEGFRAQRIAKVHLETGRQGIVVELPCNMKAFQLNVWDTVMVSIDRLGWDQKVFRVIDWKFAPSGGVDLVLREEASEVYDWNQGDATVIDFAPDTNLSSAITVNPPTGVTISFTADSNRLRVSWTASADPFVVSYQVEYMEEDDADWTVTPLTSGTSIDLGNLLPGDYTVRVKAINTLGVSSTYSTVTQIIGTGVSVDTYPILISIILSTWEPRNTPNNVALQGIAWGIPVGSPDSEGIFVAVGAHDGVDAYIITSADGTTWTERSNPSRSQLNDVIFGGNQFVAVGSVPSGSPTDDATILTSPDGVTWTERSNPKIGRNLLGVAYGVPSSSPSQGIYVAVGFYRNFIGSEDSDAYIITSPDGVTWTERANPKAVDLYDVIWAEELGLFVAVGDNVLGSPTDDTYIITSPDGITWTERSNPGNVRLNSVAWNGSNLLVAVGDNDGTDALILRSSDGINWAESQHERSPGTSSLSDIIWNGSVFVAVGSLICSSSDGLIWTVRPSVQSALFGLNCVAWSGRAHVAAGAAAGSPSGAYLLRSLAVS
jgi:hypothetical protein